MTILTAEVLRGLHRIHRQLSDLKARLQAGPKQIRAAEANIAKFQQDLADAKELVKRNRMAIDEKDLQLRERENRIATLKSRLNGASNNREYQAFLEQIAADDQANSVLSDEILELMEKTNELQNQVKEADKRLEKAKSDLEGIRKKVDEQHVVLESEVARLRTELAKAESTLPSDFRAHYLRIVKAKGEHGLAPLDGEYCGGCYQAVTTQMQNDLKLLKPVFCKSCGCILYLPEE
jgi:predicted  nucleic acid-binding Zn-ribbon protein